MGKGRGSDKQYRATQQKIAAGMAIVTSGSVLAQPSKADFRAMIPPYDESKVKKIASVKGKKSKK